MNGLLILLTHYELSEQNQKAQRIVVTKSKQVLKCAWDKYIAQYKNRYRETTNELGLENILKNLLYLSLLDHFEIEIIFIILTKLQYIFIVV